jgi:hypothetical protein
MPSPTLVAHFDQTIRTTGEARERFSEWPIRAACLRALSDLGLSDAKIADYFHVGTEQVTCLRNSYRIVEGQWKA